MAEKKSAPAPSGSLGPVESLVNGVVLAIPVPQLKAWSMAFFHPAEAFDANKADANAGAVMVHMALVGVLAAIAVLFSSVFSFNILAAVASLLLIVIYPIAFIIAGFIGSLVYFVIAKILGGKGSFMEQTLGIVLLTGGYYVLAFPFIALSGIPVVGGLLGLVVMLVGLYNIYNQYLMAKRIHQFSSGRALLFVFLPIILLVVIALVIVAVLGLAFLGAMGASSIY